MEKLQNQQGLHQIFNDCFVPFFTQSKLKSREAAAIIFEQVLLQIHEEWITGQLFLSYKELLAHLLRQCLLVIDNKK